MDADMIKSITDAEQKGAALLAGAENEAKRTLSDARKKGEDILRKAQDEIKTRALEIRRAAEQKAADDAAQSDRLANQRADEWETLCASKIQLAAESIFERIVSG